MTDELVFSKLRQEAWVRFMSDAMGKIIWMSVDGKVAFDYEVAGKLADNALAEFDKRFAPTRTPDLSDDRDEGVPPEHQI